MTTIQITKQITDLRKTVVQLKRRIDVLTQVAPVHTTQQIRPQLSIWKQTAGILKDRLKNVDPVKLQRQWRKEWE